MSAILHHQSVLPPLVTDEELRRELQFVQDFRIAEASPTIAGLVRAINPHEHDDRQEHLRHELVRSLAAFHAWHERVPFAPVSTRMSGQYVLGYDYTTNLPITLSDSETQHVLINGPTGSGKSHLVARLLHPILDSRREHVVIFDQKDDERRTLKYEHVLDFNSLAYAPLAPPPYGDLTSFRENILALYRDIYFGADLQTGALTPALNTLITPTNTPSLADLQTYIKDHDKTPAGKAAVQRLETINVAYPAIFTSTTNCWDALHETSLYVGVRGPLSQATRFLFWHLITERWRALREQGHRDRTHTTIILDEGPSTFSKRQHTVSGMASTPAQLLTVMREHGMRCIVATPSWTELDPLALAQFHVQIALHPSDGRELAAISKTFRLNEHQASVAATMQQGIGLCTMREIDHPFLITYPPYDKEKHVDNAILAAASERTRHFAAKEKCKQPATAIMPSPSAPARAAAAPIALNTNERALINYIGERTIVLTTEAMHDLRLHPQAFARAKNKLVNLHLITAERIRCRSGRGGSAVALTLTTSGATQATCAIPHQTRGNDSAQHRYLVTRVAAAMPSAQVELTLGTKSIDMVIPYNTGEHAQLSKALADVPLNDGDLVAIEVETHPSKTAANNIAKNAAAGVALTIVAVLPQDLAVATRIATQYRAIAVDALLLLDLLRGAG
jgi:energy-coupling factor transporter ATP-binding protein EcfA2